MSVDSKRLRELAESATPGQWRWGEFSKERGGVQEHPMNLYAGEDRITPIIWLEPSSGWVTQWANSEWIAAANPQTILALLDQLAAVTAARDELANIAEGALHPGKGAVNRPRIAELRKVGQ